MDSFLYIYTATIVHLSKVSEMLQTQLFQFVVINQLENIAFDINVCWAMLIHYDDVIMGTIASQITSLTIVYSTVYSGADQSKHQSSASLAFVWGIHRGPVNSPHKWPVTRKMFPFDDVIMIFWLLSGPSNTNSCRSISISMSSVVDYTPNHLASLLYNGKRSTH